MMKVKIIDREDLVKDTATGAVINTDNIALQRAKRRSENAAKKADEIETLKSDVTEIKSLLKQILDRE